jgi:putative ABC transport system permease protein
MEFLLNDIRYALRTLTRSPAFAAVAVITIALGIGANTAIFSVVNAVLLRPLPYEQPDRLVYVWGELRNRNIEYWPASPFDLRDFREQGTLFESFAGIFTGQTSLTGGDGDPIQVEFAGVTPNFLSVLGVRPAVGRDFVPDDAAPIGDDVDPDAAPPTAVLLSHGLWLRRFGGDSTVVGRTFEIGGNAVEIVGIMPRGFEFLVPAGTGLSSNIDLWFAPRIDFDNWPTRANVIFSVFGRLKPGVSVAQAQSQMDGIAARIREEDQLSETSGYYLRVTPMQEDVTKHVRPLVLALLGAVGFVLLIACANVSNLLLVRASARQREVAIRAAVGGDRLQLIRQMLVESGVLALLGAAVGLVLAWGGIRTLFALRPEDLPRIDSVGIDPLVLLFTVAAALGAALLFGSIPALQASKPDLADQLSDRGYTTTRGRQRLLRNGIVVFEVALSFVLLIGAGLMLRSFVELQRVRPGFDPKGVLTFQIQLPGSRYPEAEQRANFDRLLTDRIEGLAGVESVSAAFPLPLDGTFFAGRYGTEEALTDETSYGQADYRIVLPGYFETMGTRLLAGRTFNEADFADSAAVVVIDRRLAQLTWPNESPVGKRMLIRVTTNDAQWVEVIGVVEHQRSQTLAADGRETVYFTTRYVGDPGALIYIVRSAVAPTRLTDQIRALVAEMDPLLPLANVRTLEDYVGEAMAPTRFALILIGVFGVIALALAAVGLYGVIAYVVRQRTAEIGIRMAFGAEASGILGLVLRQGLVLTALGLAVGLLAAFWVTRFMASLLVGVAPSDPLTFAVIAVLFVPIATAACLLPARRAARVDPVVALREE